MKTKSYLGLVAIAVGLTACSKEDIDIDNSKAEYDQMRYIAVQIGAPVNAETRDFENGAVNESYINRLDFFFYDATGHPTSTPLSMTESEISANGTFAPDPNPNGNNVTRIYSSVVPVALTQGQNLPSQIICVVNGVESGVNEIKTLPLSDLIDVQRTYFNNQSCFVMTNSVYYGRDIVTGQTNQRLCATPINASSQLFGTKEAAEKAITSSTAGAIVDIYVERVAAKVGLTLDSDNIEDYKLETIDGTEVILKFEPKYWAMNATDKSIYLTKRYGVESTEGAVTTINRLPSYDEINRALTTGGFLNWNDAANHRSYWGTSPSYFANNYPDVSDDVNDLVEPSHADDFESRYYSYNELVDRAGQGIGSQSIAASAEGSFRAGYTGTQEGYQGLSTNGYIYTRETTVSKARINDVINSNPAAAVASAVVVGKYTVQGAATENGTFYIDRNSGENGIYYSKASDVIKTLASRQAVVFEDNQGKIASGAAVFSLKHPDAAVRRKAQTKLAGRLVTLQITSLPTDRHLFYYVIKADGTGGYVEISNDNLDDVNTQLLSVGYMDKFAQGLAFYSIPIRHSNWNDDFYVKKWTEEVEVDGEITTVEHEKPVGSYNWAAMTTGSLGVVRNHVYNLTINSITGLGTALRDPDQPIVPAKEEANQYIAARLNILGWNVANTWSVDL